MFESISIIGVGLIGGSIAKSARERGIAKRVIGYSRNPTNLEYGKNNGLLDEIASNLEQAVSASSFVIFSTPVNEIAKQIIHTREKFLPGTLVTDVGSTKAKIVEQLDGKLPIGVEFVGSHPLAGSEKSGPQYADSQLFQGRWVIITPNPESMNAGYPNQKVELLTNFWKALGSRVQIMDAQKHDQILGYTSHLPHLLAAALSGSLPKDWSDFTATGFRDTTRIAAGDPKLWTDIFLNNRDWVLDHLQTWENHLGIFRQALVEKNAELMKSWLLQAKKVRDDLGS